MRKYTNYEQKKNTRSAVLYIGLTIAALAILYFLGIPAVGKLASLVSSLRNKNNAITSSDTTPPPPPKFKYFSEYTNQKNVTLSGNTEAGTIVRLTFNGEDQEILSDNNGQFSFALILGNGINSFAAIAMDQAGNQSQKTDDYQITFDNQAPDLSITSPDDNSSYYGSGQRQITVQGETEEGVQVTINDRFITVDEDGKFQYTTTLNEGANTFNIKAKDKAENTTEKSITLNFSP